MLSSLFAKKGERYCGQLDYNDAVMFSAYTNVRFGNIHYGPLYPMLHQVLPGIPLLRNVWRSESAWERTADAWRRCQFHQRPYCISSRLRRVACHSRRIHRRRRRSPSP